MKKISMLLLLASATSLSFAQDIDKILNAKEVERIERTLSADDMEGRATFTRGNDKAAAFIADEFKKAGLQTWNGGNSFLQSFSMVRTKTDSLLVMLDGVAVPAKNVALVTSQPELNINQSSGYEKASIARGANLGTEVAKYRNPTKNYIVFVDTSFANNFPRLQPRGASFKNNNSVIYILTPQDAKTFSVYAKNTLTEQKLQNVVGVIPGKSRKNEYVIFGGHYDHLGISTRNMINNDSIYNGANDDAAGTTAVMMLAKYFKAVNDNERTLIFAAFTAEEVGGFGATYFSQQYNPADVMAMFNIEMIGTESKWGKNSAYITGYERTDMGKILQGNLEGSGFTFYPDPYPTQQLFFRSDNATLARLGVPAHTISTSKMENPPEPNYHKASDEIATLDMENMAKIIKSIAISSKGIISGKETPSRVDVSNLNRPAR
jgi:hypothetical protein